MPTIIYYSRALTWYLQNPRGTCHVSRNVSQRLTNFKVQKVQKLELSGLTVNWVSLYTLSAFRKYMSALWRSFLHWLRPLKCDMFNPYSITLRNPSLVISYIYTDMRHKIKSQSIAVTGSRQTRTRSHYWSSRANTYMGEVGDIRRVVIVNHARVT